MKRYRVLNFDLDSRPSLLAMEIRDEWEPEVRVLHEQNQVNIRAEVLAMYGQDNAEQKIQNLIDLGDKPFSIQAFHNIFLHQVRNAFVMGAYYPALTGATALGERVLNHLILLLRDDFKRTPEYKRVYAKKSFDNWDDAIGVLETWGVLLPNTVAAFKTLKEVRNGAIHFHPDTDTNDRALAFRAIHLLQDIVREQFPASASRPWLFLDIPGETYIRKDHEQQPFVKHVYVPNAHLVGPKHHIEYRPEEHIFAIEDEKYSGQDITDMEFVQQRTESKNPSA